MDWRRGVPRGRDFGMALADVGTGTAAEGFIASRRDGEMLGDNGVGVGEIDMDFEAERDNGLQMELFFAFSSGDSQHSTLRPSTFASNVKHGLKRLRRPRKQWWTRASVGLTVGAEPFAGSRAEPSSCSLLLSLVSRLVQDGSTAR